MDTYGFIAIAAGVFLWLWTRKSNPKAATAGLVLAGFGAGIVVGAFGSFMIVSSALP